MPLLEDEPPKNFLFFKKKETEEKVSKDNPVQLVIGPLLSIVSLATAAARLAEPAP